MERLKRSAVNWFGSLAVPGADQAPTAAATRARNPAIFRPRRARPIAPPTGGIDSPRAKPPALPGRATFVPFFEGYPFRYAYTRE